MNQSREGNAAGSNRAATLGVCVFLVAITWIVFGQTRSYDFINYDDNVYVYDNPIVAAGLSKAGIFWAFSHVHGGNWHPLTSISHMLDCSRSGLNPGGHHLTNVFLHILGAVLLFLALRNMTGALGGSAFVAAVFAIDPLRVESVAWISERKDVLSGVFFMLTLLAYSRYVSRPFSLSRYLLVVCLFVFGLMAKPMLVTLPCVLLLLDYWPLRRLGFNSLGNGVNQANRAPLFRVVVEKIPLFALSLASSIVTWRAQQTAMRTITQVPLFSRAVNAVLSYVRYLWQLLWPVNLAPFYPYQRQISLLSLAAAALLLIAISALVLSLGKKRPYLVTGWGWYLVMLLPVIGFVQVGAQAMADRYTYLPHIGVVLAVTWTIADPTAGSRSLRRLLGFVAAGATIALAWGAYHQTRYWRTSESLWLHTLAVTNDNYVAHSNLGDVCLKAGRTDDAIHELQAALRIAPDFSVARNNLGLAFLNKGRVTEGIQEFRRVLSREPQNAKCRFNLAAAFLESGRAAEAIQEYEKALAIQPKSAQGHSDLGNAYLHSRRFAEAIAQYKIALQLRPHYADAEYNFGIAEIQNGNRAEAIRHFQNALVIEPNYPAAHNNLAVALLLEGRTEEAIAHLERSVAAEPGNVQVRNNLARALTGKQQWNRAVAHWRTSLQIDGNNLDAQIGLAWALATAPDNTVRNGPEALTIAQHLAATMNDPTSLRVLAAACAELGHFAEATKIAGQAVDLVTSQHDTELTAKLRSDLALYQSGQPLRDAGSSPPTR
jgi:protein O-mannosyl-transferase